jgi:hypothetical protein
MGSRSTLRLRNFGRDFRKAKSPVYDGATSRVRLSSDTRVPSAFVRA